MTKLKVRYSFDQIVTVLKNYSVLFSKKDMQKCKGLFFFFFSNVLSGCELANLESKTIAYLNANSMIT